MQHMVMFLVSAKWDQHVLQAQWQCSCWSKSLPSGVSGYYIRSLNCDNACWVNAFKATWERRTRWRWSGSQCRSQAWFQHICNSSLYWRQHHNYITRIYYFHFSWSLFLIKKYWNFFCGASWYRANMNMLFINVTLQLCVVVHYK